MVRLDLYFNTVHGSCSLPYFWTFCSIIGCSRAAGSEWVWCRDVKQLTVELSCSTHSWTEKFAQIQLNSFPQEKERLSRALQSRDEHTYVGSKFSSLTQKWNLPLTTYTVTLTYSHMTEVRTGLQGTVSSLQMATSVLPPHLFWRTVYLFISAISAPRDLLIFFNCYDFEGKLWKLALPVLLQIAYHQKMAWKYFTLWSWEVIGLAAIRQTCPVFSYPWPLQVFRELPGFL